MKRKNPVSVVVPLWNAESTIVKSLNSLLVQDYPIREIIVVDNCSTDRSAQLVQQFAKKNTKIPIMLISRSKRYGVSASYNLGVRKSKSELVVILHSDSVLPGKHEISKLVSPLNSSAQVVASIPFVVHPIDIWNQYNFWQKCHFARVAGTAVHSGNAKFDCVKKSVFIKVGGFDENTFTEHVGSEDADFYSKISREGKVYPSEARVYHLHRLDDTFSLWDWVAARRYLSQTYGSHLRLHLRFLDRKALAFLVKPILGIGSLVPGVQFVAIPLLVIFPFLYMKKMFLMPGTRTDPKIVLLPFITIALVYYETYWMVRRFINPKR